jgi:hypothetical protein
MKIGEVSVHNVHDNTALNYFADSNRMWQWTGCSMQAWQEEETLFRVILALISTLNVSAIGFVPIVAETHRQISLHVHVIESELLTNLRDRLNKSLTVADIRHTTCR